MSGPPKMLSSETRAKEEADLKTAAWCAGSAMAGAALATNFRLKLVRD